MRVGGNADRRFCAQPSTLEANPRAPLGAESLRARASPFGVPSASLRLSRVLPPRPRRRHGREAGLRPSFLRPSPPPRWLYDPAGGRRKFLRSKPQTDEVKAPPPSLSSPERR